MGGRGPAPKPINLRQRRNKKAGAAKLPISNKNTSKKQILNKIFQNYIGVGVCSIFYKSLPLDRMCRHS
jgi:hypothetical protein